MMTKRHFEALAAALAEVRQSYAFNDDAIDAIDKVAEGVAKVCAKSNVNFNRVRFLEAARAERKSE